jgi:hypothetical protein
VSDGSNSITLNVDPGVWFVGAHGQVLDPSNPMNRGQILANIRCSVRMSSMMNQQDGGQLRRDFDDDDDHRDRCREADDDGDHGGDGERKGDDREDHGGDNGGDCDHRFADSDRCGGPDDGHHSCPAPPPLDCGDAGAAEDAGTADAGTDGGT